MSAIYPFVGGTSTTHSYNLKNTAQYQLTFNGGGTHASTGWTPNGTNGYANTGISPASVLSLNNQHISYYSRTNSNGTEIELGNGSGSYQTFLEIRTSGTTYYCVNNTGGYLTASDSDSRAFYVANRTASNVLNGWKNGTKVANGTNPSTGLWSGNLYLGAWNYDNVASFYTTKEVAFSSIGDGLSDTEAANFYTAVQTFQTTLGRQVGTPIPFTMPLDTYSGASAAYSAARRLSSSYTGALIRVRRSSDNTEQDIGYNGSNVLDESALTTFVGANNGFITKWYDQSGNAIDHAQSTAANQPKIVSSGTVNKINGKPAILFNGSSTYLYAASSSYLNIGNHISNFYVWEFNSDGGFYGGITEKGYGQDGGYAWLMYSNGSRQGFRIEADSLIDEATSMSNSTQYLSSNINKTGTNGIKTFRNGTQKYQYTTASDLSGTNSSIHGIGRLNSFADYWFNGNLQELIFYPSDQTTNRNGIESNINTYFTIY